MGLPWKRLGALTGSALGLATFNTWVAWKAGAVESKLPGASRYYHWTRDEMLYNVFYKVRGEGQPVVLIHGIHAAASSAEMGPVYDNLGTSARVYALDLLGFGLSDRPSLDYRPAVYLDLLVDFLESVVKEPAVVVASSLSAAYAIEIAARRPDLVRGLVLVCPTGIERLASKPRPEHGYLRSLLTSPLIGSALFNLIVSRAALGYFLREQAYADPAGVDDALVDDYYVTAHQDGARYAPAAFVTDHLNLNISSVFGGVTVPVTIVWGREAGSTPSSDANAFLQVNPSIKLEVLAHSRLLPHVERVDAFMSILRRSIDVPAPAQTIEEPSE